MPLAQKIRVLYLSYFSKPSVDRLVYRVVHRRQFRRIVELGVGFGWRAVRMIEVAALQNPIDRVSYTGVDLFEARTAVDGPGATLKMAHRLLTRTGARIRLVPGDPFTALSRAANALAGTDLVVISARQDPSALARAWFYLPRMLHPGSHVLIEEPSDSRAGPVMRSIPADEINRRAAAASLQRAA